MCDNTAFKAINKFSKEQIKDTLKSALDRGMDNLGELLVAIDIYILANDLGDEVYKQRCEAEMKLCNNLGKVKVVK